jgi:Aspartyl protease/PDZ domain
MIRWERVLWGWTLAVLGAATAQAEITPDAAKVLTRFVEATGGEASVTGVHSSFVRAHVNAFGLQGSTTVWTRTPDARVEFTAIGPIHVSTGCLGDRAWRIDPSGALAWLDGKDLEEARASVWFDLERWLAPDQGGGRIAVVADAGSPNHTTLEITPPYGQPRRYLFRRDNGLLDRVRGRMDQSETTSELSDYRPGPTAPGVPARLTPFAVVTKVEGMSANDITIRIDSMAINVEVEDERFAPPTSAGADDATFLRTPGHATLPFEYQSRHVWLRAAVNGQPPADFLYDTGASMTVLDSAYAARIGIKTEGRLQSVGAGASGGAALGALDSLRVSGPDGDGILIRNQKIAVLSINPVLEPYFWRECAGVIGYDFITRFVNEIDYDTHRLTLHDPMAFAPPESSTAIPMQLAGTIPVVTVTIDDTLTGLFRVDVGSGSTVDLHTPYVRTHKLDRGSGARVPVYGGGFGGTFQTTLTRMKSIQIGPFGIQGPVIGLSGATAGALASEDYAGNIGNQLLERFHCAFDYQRRVLYLRPGAKFTGRDRFTRAGVLLARSGDQVLVAQVVPGSAAERAGLQAGDVVAKLDGRAPLEVGHAGIDEKFEAQPVGTKVQLEIVRKGKSKKVTLKLAELL